MNYIKKVLRNGPRRQESSRVWSRLWRWNIFRLFFFFFLIIIFVGYCLLDVLVELILVLLVNLGWAMFWGIFDLVCWSTGVWFFLVVIGGLSIYSHGVSLCWWRLRVSLWLWRLGFLCFILCRMWALYLIVGYMPLCGLNAFMLAFAVLVFLLGIWSSCYSVMV